MNILSPKRHEKGLWWDRNWPVLEGCTPCSPACDNCFASGYAHRFKNSLPYLRGLTTPEGKWNGTVALRKDQLKLPSTIKKPTVWFVTERSDLFHPAVPFGYILAILTYAVMAPHHRYMILTKRPERMAEFFKWMDTESTYSVETLQDCFWFGVTVWDQASADKNIPMLLSLPVAHRFISIEPMLGAIDLTQHLKLFWRSTAGIDLDAPQFEPRLNLVICGGESGNNARPMHPNWVISVRDKCRNARVPFFFKQWGEWVPGEHGHEVPIQRWAEIPEGEQVARPLRLFGEEAARPCQLVARVGKKIAGRLIDGKEYLELPL